MLIIAKLSRICHEFFLEKFKLFVLRGLGVVGFFGLRTEGVVFLNVAKIDTYVISVLIKESYR